MPKLTKRTVDAAEGREKEYFLWDDDLAGFGLRVRPSGRKTYVVQYRSLGRRPRRMNLGQHNVVPLEKARIKAMGILSEVGNGADPSAKRQETRDALTVDDLAKRFDTEHIALHVKPSTANGYRINLRTIILPAFGKMAITDVTRMDVARLNSRLHKQPAKANRCLGVISKMFNLAELWGLRPDGSNPTRHIRKYPDVKRDRYLTMEELVRLGSVLKEIETEGIESPYAVAAIRLLVMTGCRLGEIMTLKWEYVNWNIGALCLPDSKTGAKTVLLGKSALALLASIERIADNPWVIAGNLSGARRTDLQPFWQRTRKRVGIEDVRIHDLRHTFASNGVGLGLSLPLIGKLLGHTQVQTTARYAHLAMDPVREAAGKITLQLAELLALPMLEPEDISPPNPAQLTGVKKLPAPDLPRYLTAIEAAQVMGIDPRLLENWRWKRIGPHYIKLCGKIRYALPDIEAFASQSKRNGENCQLMVPCPEG